MGTRIRRRRRYGFTAGLVFIVALSLLTACAGKEEPVVTQIGIDGYVYVPRWLKTASQDWATRLYNIYDMQMAGSFLYYTQWTDYGQEIKRVSLPEEAQASELEVLDFDKAETVLAVSSGFFVVPEEMLADGEVDLDAFMESWDDSQKAKNPDLEEYHCTFSFESFTVDSEGRLYLCLAVSAGRGLELEEAGRILCRYGMDGQMEYWVQLPEASAPGIASDKAGRVFLLEEGGITVIESEGIRGKSVSTREYCEGRNIRFQKLYGDRDGKVYYTIFYDNYEVKLFEVVSEGEIRLREIKGFGGGSNLSLEGIEDGKIYFSDLDKDIFYQYDIEHSSGKEVLRWQDSDLFVDYVRQAWRLGEDDLLVWYSAGTWSEFCLLRKMRTEDVPQKELVVLASLSPTQDLQEAVIEFNRQSDKYHCVIERYGADAGASVRLDATLVSSAPPDILELRGRDILMYVEKGVLEDLSPYLEHSAVDREDFLENLLEGYTINGKLVCIPTCFSINMVAGRESQMDGLEGWSMEDVYQLVEEHPEQTELLGSGFTGLIKDRDYMLEEFCAAYYMEKYVDWEAGKSSFDSPEFARLLAWAGEHAEAPSPETAVGRRIHYPEFVPENTVLMTGNGWDFEDVLVGEIKMGEKLKLLGFPTVGGKGAVSVNVMDELGMVSQGRNKDGAWEFLEYYLSREQGDSSYLPTRKSLLEAAARQAVELTDPGKGALIVIADEGYYYHLIPQEHAQELADMLMEMIESIDFSPKPKAWEQIIHIVMEEAGSYYNGDKTLEEATALIQNRATLLLQEKK